MKGFLGVFTTVLVLGLGGGVGMAHAFSSDPSFGDRGWVSSDSDSGWPRLAFDGKGRLLVSAYHDQGSIWNSIKRFGPEGAPDLTFGRNGGTFMGSGGGSAYWDYDAAGDIAVQPDGRILVAGALVRDNNDSDSGPDYRPYVVRYMADGTIDRSFADQGSYAPTGATDFITNGTQASLAVRSDGGILVAGSFASLDSEDGATVILLDSRGRLDRKFADRGTFLMTPKRYGEMNEFTDLKLTGSGSALVSGRVGGRPVVVKLDRRGRLARGFGGGDGVVRFRGSQSFCDTIVYGCEAGARMARGNGRIYVLASARVDGKATRYLFALRKDGTEDRGFGRRARRSTSTLVRGSRAELTDMAMEANGRLVVSGGRYTNGSGTSFIATLDRRGGLVRHDGRRFMTLPPPTIDTVTDIAFDPEGRLMAAGFKRELLEIGEGDEYRSYEARYLRIARFR